MKRLAAYSIIYRRGTACILVLIGAIVAYRVYIEQKVVQEQTQIVWFEEVIVPQDTGFLKSKKPLRSIKVNLITTDELQTLGLEKTVADRWIKYRYSLSNFADRKEIESIYGLPDSWLEDFSFDFTPGIKKTRKVMDKTRPTEQPKLKRVQDTLSGRPDADTVRYAVNQSEDRQQVVIDINDSNEYQWQLLPGIGPYYARRIVNFRNKLGGFHSIGQVADTYGLPDSVYQSIVPMLKESAIFQKLSINKLSASELASHPYIRFKEASVLCNYRNNHGPYESIQELYQIKAFDSLFIERLRPYLKFNFSQETAQASEGQNEE